MTDTPARLAAAQAAQQPTVAELPYLTDAEIVAGAKFYARASQQRAVNGVIPNWDDEADEANWQRTRPDVREGMLDMVRGIVVACEFGRHKDAAFARVRGKPSTQEEGGAEFPNGEG